MKNLSFHPKPRDRNHQGEIIETEIADWHSKQHLPRHISAPETKSHRGRYNLERINYAPTVCRLDASDPTKTHLTLNILKYQLSDRLARNKHLENVRSNLNRRLKVAKAKGNEQLINILQEEYQQLEASV